MAAFCWPEEKEDHHRRVVVLWAQTWLPGRPADPGHTALLRQAVRDRAGGAQNAGWVGTSPVYLTSSVTICWCAASLRSRAALPRLPDSCFLSSNDLTHTLASYLKQGECCSILRSSVISLLLNTLFFFLFNLSVVIPSLSQVGQNPKAAYRKEFCGSAYRL